MASKRTIRSWKLVGKFSEKTIPEERAEEAFRCETQSKVFTTLYNIPAVKRIGIIFSKLMSRIDAETLRFLKA
ncbi:hypothetical protein BT96DRAFT_142793 [Gymnopus androsaceus JB14]|uniref:Uncharacterized protein n=1 Tax=Gymnopus androsaceus JB14 TaxID=1447944 RepID=A0A6A4GBY9_9AGAR|nr:hypothetical protein BT96DRAFT_142793 [Gymnopus androsaceus JB14]